MRLSKNIILEILDILFNIFEHKCIVTGSCSDMFNINFEDIKDIDIVIDEDSFNKFRYKINNNILFTLLGILNGINGKNGTRLYRYLYMDYQVDITIILSGSELDYEIKIKKAHDRLETYENLFGLQMRDKTDSRNDT